MLWFKAFHIIFMVTWFAGLFYLPRLFVYHAGAEDEVSNARFKIMERKLYYGIMAPGAVLTVLFGMGLWSYAPGAYSICIWFLAKVAFVILTISYHLYLGHLLKLFQADRNPHNHVFYRWLNEVPVLFLVGIVILVIVKPWGTI